MIKGLSSSGERLGELTLFGIEKKGSAGFSQCVQIPEGKVQRRQRQVFSEVPSDKE